MRDDHEPWWKSLSTNQCNGMGYGYFSWLIWGADRGYGDTIYLDEYGWIVMTSVTCDVTGMMVHGFWESSQMDPNGCMIPAIFMLPSGKLTVCYGKSPFCSWENPLFLWPCSIAMWQIARGDGGSLVRTAIGEENAQGQLNRPLKAIRRGLRGGRALVAVEWLNYLEKMAELLLMIDIIWYPWV